MYNDENIGGPQLDAITRCRDTKPITAEEARKLLALFPAYRWYRAEREVQILIARVSLDQSVRLEESIDNLEKKSSNLSKQLVSLTWALTVFTVALFVLAFVTYAKG